MRLTVKRVTGVVSGEAPVRNRQKLEHGFPSAGEKIETSARGGW